MTGISLTRLLKPTGPLAQFLKCLPGVDEEVSIIDTQGSQLWGAAAPASTNRVEIVAGEQHLGWVYGGSNPGSLANLIAAFATQENEKKILAGEVLDRYRELNLLYHLSESLAENPHPDAIARTILASAIRIIPAGIGQILLKPAGSQTPEVLAAHGAHDQVNPSSRLVRRVLATGKAEMVNYDPITEQVQEPGSEIYPVICVPLKTEKNVLGAIILACPQAQTFSAGDLKLLNTIAQQAAPMIEVSRLYQVEIEKTRLESELQLARQVQESLLPERMPEIAGWEFEKRWHPLHNVSGDFYDLIKEGPQRLGLVIADVTGKGMPASLFMVFVRSILRASISRRSLPDQVLANANRTIYQDSTQGLFATLIYARLDTGSGELVYANAGHPPAILYRRSQDSVQFLPRTGLPLGADSRAAYTCATVKLEEGDFALFYTDGMIETENGTGEEFGMERLAREVYTHRNESTSSLLDSLERVLSDFTPARALEDDLTLLMVRRA